mmetsp:Transcript_10909/g.40673  ORF Transcript_10909/g.40673 Transcript_10909/m.40673 type:complete len:100 (+) Transcript_10909:199-498(+)
MNLVSINDFKGSNAFDEQNYRNRTYFMIAWLFVNYFTLFVSLMASVALFVAGVADAGNGLGTYSAIVILVANLLMALSSFVFFFGRYEWERKKLDYDIM